MRLPGPAAQPESGLASDLGGRRGQRARLLRLVLSLVVVTSIGVGVRIYARERLLDPGVAGDGLQYWHIAGHIAREHRISIDGTTPEWTRLPGFPAFLALTTAPGDSVAGSATPIANRARVQGWIRRMSAVNLGVDLLSALALGLLALWLGARSWAALLVAGYWALQPWTSVVAVHPLSDPLAALLATLTLGATVLAIRDGRARAFALAGLLAGLGQYVRGDGVLLLAPLVLAGFCSTGTWRRRCARSAVAIGVYALVFAPWPLRNLATFGAPHSFGGAIGVDVSGKPVDRSALFEWLRTVSAGGEAETMRLAWRLGTVAIPFAEVPTSAWDTEPERVELAAWFADYDRAHGHVDEALSQRLRAIAEGRRARHPFRSYVGLPLLRAYHTHFAPRDGYSLGLAPLLPRARAPLAYVDNALTALGLVGLVLLLWRRHPAALPLLAYVALRLLLSAWLPSTEPRYALPVLPLLFALVATLPRLARVATLPRLARPGDDS